MQGEYEHSLPTSSAERRSVYLIERSKFFKKKVYKVLNNPRHDQSLNVVVANPKTRHRLRSLFGKIIRDRISFERTTVHTRNQPNVIVFTTIRRSTEAVGNDVAMMNCYQRRQAHSLEIVTIYMITVVN